MRGSISRGTNGHLCIDFVEPGVQLLFRSFRDTGLAACQIEFFSDVVAQIVEFWFSSPISFDAFEFSGPDGTAEAISLVKGVVGIVKVDCISLKSCRLPQEWHKAFAVERVMGGSVEDRRFPGESGSSPC
jgi:hypothetical protein